MQRAALASALAWQRLHDATGASAVEASERSGAEASGVEWSEAEPKPRAQLDTKPLHAAAPAEPSTLATAALCEEIALSLVRMSNERTHTHTHTHTCW